MEYRTYEVTDSGTDRVIGPKWRVYQWPLVAGCVISTYTILSLPLLLAQGGGASLVPIILLTFFIGGPLIYVQLKLGGITESNITTMFGRSIPILKGVGVAAMLYLVALVSISQLTLAYSLVYAYYSLKSDPLPWSTCSNKWNTPACREGTTRMQPGSTPRSSNPGFLANVSVFGVNSSVPYGASFQTAEYSHTPAQEYFFFAFLQVTDGYGEMGKILSYVAGALALAWLVTFLLTCWGPRIYGFIVIFLSLGSLVIIFLLIGRSQHAFSYHVQKGLSVYYSADWSTLKDIKVWSHALGFVLQGAVIFHGVLPTFGKFAGHGRVTTNLTWLPVLLCVLIVPNLVVIMLSPFMSILSHGYAKPSVYYRDPTSLLFVNVPDVSVLMESGLVGFLIFLWVMFHGLLNQSLMTLVLLDSLTEGFRDVLKKIYHRKFVVRLFLCVLLCLVLFLIGLAFATQGGPTIAYLLSVFMQIGYPVLYLLAVVGFTITYAKQNQFSNLQKIFVLVVFCVLSVAVLIPCGINAYEIITTLPVKYAGTEHRYPESSNLAGLLSVGLPLGVGIITGILHAFFTANGGCSKRCAFLFKGAPVPRRRKSKPSDSVVSMRLVGGLPPNGQAEPLMTNEKKPSSI